jgi:hypothetical protein
MTTTSEPVAERDFARIECNEAPMVGVFYLMAVVLPLLAWLTLWIFGVPMRFNVPEREFNPLVLLPVVAALAGLFFLVVAIFMTLRLRRFGVSVLTLDRRPRIGGRLLGRIASTVEVTPRDEWHLGFRCVETFKSAGSRGQIYTADVVRWEYTTTMPAHAHSLKTGIPVDIPIPEDCLELKDPIELARPKRGAIRWDLFLKGKRDGLDYLASFAVPIRSELQPR